jgi:hypothetical protein
LTRTPKSIKSHYVDSFAVNLENLKSILFFHNISSSESDKVTQLISKTYNQKMDFILEQCGDDWTKLESFSSPLIIFVQCIGELLDVKPSSISADCRFILNSFVKTIESWMIW